MSMPIIFLIAFVIIMLIGYIFRTATKFFLVVVAIFVLFGMGFIWGPNDLNEKLGLSRYLTPQASQQVDSFYTKFTQKRDQYGSKVINQDQMKQDYYSAESTAKTQSQSWFTTAKNKVLQFFGLARQEATTEMNQIQSDIQNEIKNDVQNAVQQEIQNTIQTTTPTTSTQTSTPAQ